MTPMQLLRVYIAGAFVTTVFIWAFHKWKGGKLDVDDLVLILPWPFTWLCLLVALMYIIAHLIGYKLAEIVEDFID